MASRYSAEESREKSNLLKTPVNNADKKHSRRCKPFRYYCERLSSRALPLPIKLLVFYVLPCVIANVLVNTILHELCLPISHGCYEPQPSADDDLLYLTELFCITAIHLLIPISGWLSDSIFGRKQAIYFSLWMGWAGTMLLTLSECFQYHYCGIVDMVGRYGLSVLALVFLILSFTMFYATSLAYGMDLLMDSSTVKHCSFVYWYSWMFFLSGKTVSIIDHLPGKQYVEGRLAISFSACFFFSISLCLYFGINRQLEENLRTELTNPYKKTFKILKYSLIDHRHENRHRPSFRSAMTYWEESSVSRLDIAKRKYGGLYSQDEVENVKTVLRVLLVLLALVPFMISLAPVNDKITQILPQFRGGAESMDGYAGFAFYYISDNLIFLVVPILEFLIIPVFPKVEYFLANSLKGIGISQILLIVSVAMVFVIDLAANIKWSQVKCISFWSKGDLDFGISYWVLFVPSMICGIAYDIAFVCMFQFICCQSPYEMSGMIIGIFWALRSCCLCIGSLINYVTDEWDPNTIEVFSCTSWLLVIFMIISSLGLLLYVFTTRWYTKRVRSDNCTLRRAVEDHFEQQISRRPEHNLLEESEV